MRTRERYILDLALNLTSATGSADSYDKLLNIFIQALGCDAACLFRKQGETLIPLSTYGLSTEVRYKGFRIAEHPRLQVIAASKEPIVFPHDSDLQDPFDGLLATDLSATLDVHSCLGCPLIVEGEVMGVLTADSLQPRRFDAVDHELLAMIAALAGATLRTYLLIDRLEQNVADQKSLTQSALKEASAHRNLSLLGSSPAMMLVQEAIETVGPSDLSILITGETGTGKELVARQLHQKSPRKNKPLIYVNCAALPESLAESELFGHKKGAFTGAMQDRVGKFELAEEGTIFLDEIGELPLSIQPKLLRVLQEGEIQRVGSDQMKRVNIRVLAATNRDLGKEIEAGKFRADLYHRLNAYPIALPPLRERGEDIGILASYFCDVLQRKLGTPTVRLDDSAKDALMRAYWPGNVRELKNVLSRSILNSHHRRAASKVLLLTEADIEPLINPDEAAWAQSLSRMEKKDEARSLKEATRAFQSSYIVDALHRHRNNWAQTAKALGLHRSNLHHLAKRLGLI